ncbi:MerR family transcriptional regulator [Paenibacillus sp. MMS18-CY102]|uniref:MerR family transcriptional regulator n=1 Tax=Paenibacillus sp. MMS18-CY102 TaxID=2682849 RepID=UPI0013665FF7|nr:MerR family transcriptional regulator [Paenibacillus sp. MMS18-CY102]MWC28919.1 MerR family transcriptional regulator [Paenibacillus sp. MMS18-CY102]
MREKEGANVVEKSLYRIGELAKKANVSPRTIDYYTSLGLIEPERRSDKNYRLYCDETLIRLKRIEQMKAEKYSLDEIKRELRDWNKVTSEEEVSQKLSELQHQLVKLEREVKELEPVLNQLKPRQANRLYTRIIPQTAACVEALMLLMNKSNLM